jgi:hypothetical protein
MHSVNAQPLAPMVTRNGGKGDGKAYAHRTLYTRVCTYTGYGYSIIFLQYLPAYVNKNITYVKFCTVYFSFG